MISTLDIKGFKSIRKMHLDCRRVNLFIGEPNTGKSNILETLGFFSWLGHGGEVGKFLRLKMGQDLFHDGLLEPASWSLKIAGAVNSEVIAKQEREGYRFDLSGLQQPHAFGLTFAGQSSIPRGVDQLGFVKFYRCDSQASPPSTDTGPLRPPDGSNLVALLFSSRKLRQLAGDYFAPYGLQLVVKPHEHKLEVQKQSEGIVVSFPFELTSETLQRMVFYMAAIESNKGATLVFEEPEAHAFPYFTKLLGERIALDENRNQYFVATHNPYLLTAILEKTPTGEAAVFATYYRDYETRVKMLQPPELSLLLEGDPFLGVEQLVEEGA